VANGNQPVNTSCGSGMICDGSGNCSTPPCSGATLSCGSYSSCAYWDFEDGQVGRWALDSAACNNSNPIDHVGVTAGSPLGSKSLSVAFQQEVCFAVQVCGAGITANTSGLTFHAQAYWATSQSTATYLYIYSSDINVPVKQVVIAPNMTTNVVASFDSTEPIISQVGFMLGVNGESGTLYIDNAYFQ
jgi:hypothetical protein